MRIQHQTNTTENLIYSFRWKFIVFKYFRQKGRRIVEYFQLTIEVSKMVTGSQKTYIVTLNLKFRQYVDKKEATSSRPECTDLWKMTNGGSNGMAYSMKTAHKIQTKH